MIYALAIGLMLGFGQDSAPANQAALEVLRTKHIAVQVKVNGKGPVRLVFDTGSPITFLRAGAAQRIGLIDEKAAKGYSLGGLRTMVKAKTVEAGGAEVKDVSLVILDHPTIDAIGEFTGGLDGILGFSFFSRFHTIIDYAAGTISFTPTDYSPEEVFGAILRRVMLGVPERRVIASSGLWGMAVDNGVGGGVLVKKVYKGGAAESAGIREGDRILALDDRWTDSVHECYHAASGVPAGESVPVVVQRGHDRLNLSVTPIKGI